MSTPKTITVSAGMSLFDVALMGYGSVGAVFLLIDDNPGLELDTVLEEGQVLRIVSDPIDAATARYIESREIRINTGEDLVADPSTCVFPFTFPITFCN